jgi:hypothetical protein
MQKFVVAINSVGSQAWGIFCLVWGSIVILAFHRDGIDVAIGGGIIGVGANMLTASTSHTQTQTASDRPAVTVQSTESPVAQMATFPSPSTAATQPK